MKAKNVQTNELRQNMQQMIVNLFYLKMDLVIFYRPISYGKYPTF